MAGFDHFSALAPIYDRLIGTNPSKILIEIADLPTHGALLDVGGGTGRIAYVLQSHIDITVVADISFGMLQQAVRKDQLQTACAPSEYLPFHNQSFDRIVMVDALHHVYDASETCKELWRVLKPGGKIIIEEPDIRTIPVMLVALVEKLALMRSRFISPPTIGSYFNYPDAEVEIHQKGYTSWISITKTSIVRTS
jgi:demethylmenaquinone methyltransferase/2-methoxy-6-polyprenyl-1,4-benzoquinol methylase